MWRPRIRVRPDDCEPAVGDGRRRQRRQPGKILVDSQGRTLYLFQGDQKPGDTNGQGVTAFGGGWFTLSPAGTQVAGKPSSSGGGYRY